MPSHGHSHGEHKLNVSPASASQIWLNTICSVSLISIAPFIILFFVPDLNKHQNLLKVLLAFAAGGLLGDAFLHLIPHALSPHGSEVKHEHTHSHSPQQTSVPLWVIGGIFGFLCIEKFLLFLQSAGSNRHSHKAPATQEYIAPTNKTSEEENVHAAEKNKKNKKNKNLANQNAKQSKNASGDSRKQNEQKQQQPHKSEKQIEKLVGNTNKRKNTKFQVSGYLNLAADFTHNFTDGVAIAGSYIIGGNVGFVTTLTVLVHEIPHEIGDYAILIQSGCGPYKAMLLQLITAMGALLGAAISLVVAGVGVDNEVLGFGSFILSPEFISTRLLPLTAGGFIYIALVSVMSDLLKPVSDVNGTTRPSRWQRLVQSLAELCALVVGVALMAVITIFE